METTSETARQAAIHELIAIRAYELWESQGRPLGHDLINWRQAEQDILSCVGGNSGRSPVPQHDSRAG